MFDMFPDMDCAVKGLFTQLVFVCLCVLINSCINQKVTRSRTLCIIDLWLRFAHVAVPGGGDIVPRG